MSVGKLRIAARWTTPQVSKMILKEFDRTGQIGRIPMRCKQKR